MEPVLSARIPKFRGEGAGECVQLTHKHRQYNLIPCALCHHPITFYDPDLYLTMPIVSAPGPFGWSSSTWQRPDTRTDTSAAACRVERELKRWEPEGALANLSLDMPAGKGGRGGHWDQFETNRKLFKVCSICGQQCK